MNCWTKTFWFPRMTFLLCFMSSELSTMRNRRHPSWTSAKNGTQRCCEWQVRWSIQKALANPNDFMVWAYDTLDVPIYTHQSISNTALLTLGKQKHNIYIKLYTYSGKRRRQTRVRMRHPRSPNVVGANSLSLPSRLRPSTSLSLSLCVYVKVFYCSYLATHTLMQSFKY